MLVLVGIGEDCGLLVVFDRVLHFGAVVDAELTRCGLITSRFTVAVVDVGAEVLEERLDTRLRYFEFDVVTERCLMVDIYVWCVAHR
ncbi:hypothetical protein GCM10009037_26830 [Halarchaeum grantii]|uniref:Uncharacterized protein n=1 Tax=Halarchaeum grantii TaxID=1193105 RepID=A0A830FCP7_9EURY|nr:hypothetical protein GCM10009037_26830 [Halarchaeum grantii]